MSERAEFGAARTLLALVAAVASLAYSRTAISGAANMPFWDDVILIPPGPEDPITVDKWLLQRNNEHVVALPKLVSLGLSSMTGEVDFYLLAMIGNAALLIAAVAVAMGHDSPLGRTTVTLVLLAALASIRSWENMLWPIAALQNYGAFALACVALAVADRRGPHIALLAIAPACFTSASGLFAGVTAFLPEAVTNNKRTRLRGRFGVVLFGLMATCIPLITSESGAATGAALATIPTALARILIAAGSALYLPDLCGEGPLLNAIPLATGGALIAAQVAKLVRVRPANWGTMELLSVFCLMSVAAVGVGRADLGFRQAASSRYALYSLTLVAITTVHALESLRLNAHRRRSTVTAALFGFVLLMSSAGSWESAKSRAAMLRSSQARWNESMSGFHHGPGMEDGLTKLIHATQAGTFRAGRD